MSAPGGIHEVRGRLNPQAPVVAARVLGDFGGAIEQADDGHRRPSPPQRRPRAHVNKRGGPDEAAETTTARTPGASDRTRARAWGTTSLPLAVALSGTGTMPNATACWEA